MRTASEAEVEASTFDECGAEGVEAGGTLVESRQLKEPPEGGRLVGEGGGASGEAAP